MKTYLEKEFAIAIYCHEHLSLQDVIDKHADTPCLYMFDCLQVPPNLMKNNLEIQSACVPSHILIMLYNVTDNEQLVSLVRQHQVRGIFYRDDSLAMFVKGIRTILDGHLWLTRRMLTSCILSKRKNSHQSFVVLDTEGILTRREIEILNHVAFGKSNQEAADAMQISRHTVKTHLYNIYKKINVPNRLQAAHWVATYLGTNAND